MTKQPATVEAGHSKHRKIKYWHKKVGYGQVYDEQIWWSPKTGISEIRERYVIVRYDWLCCNLMHNIALSQTWNTYTISFGENVPYFYGEICRLMALYRENLAYLYCDSLHNERCFIRECCNRKQEILK